MSATLLSGLRVWRPHRSAGWTVEQRVCPSDCGWHHIATTFYRGQLTLFVDGAEVSSVLTGWRWYVARAVGALKTWWANSRGGAAW